MDAIASYVREVAKCYMTVVMSDHDPDFVLTPKMRAFCEAFISNGGNATEAYRSAISEKCTKATAAAQGSRLKNHPAVVRFLSDASSRARASIDRALARYELSADKLTERLVRIAATDMKDICRWDKDKIEVIDSDKVDDDAHPAVSEIVKERDGTVRVKTYNKVDAIALLLRAKGWMAQPDQSNTQQLVVLKVER